MKRAFAPIWAAVALATGGASAAPFSCSDFTSAAERARMLWSKEFNQGGEPESLYVFSDNLRKIAECRAERAGDPRPCLDIAGVYNRMRDPLDAECRQRFLLAHFIDSSVRGVPSAALRHCTELLDGSLADFPLFPGSLEPACQSLAAAYRAQYTPVCARLSWDGRLNPGYNANDFLLMCETYLYTPSDHGCRILRDPAQNRQCAERARVFQGVKSGDPARCGDDPLCRALLGDWTACSSAEKSMRKACGREER